MTFCDSREEGLELRPSRQIANRLKVAAFARIRDNAHLCKAAQHHERIAGTPAQTLCACDEIHQLGIVLASLLDRAPGQIVESFEILLRSRGECGLTACRHVSTLRALRLRCYEKDGKNQREQGHDSRWYNGPMWSCGSFVAVLTDAVVRVSLKRLGLRTRAMRGLLTAPP